MYESYFKFESRPFGPQSASMFWAAQYCQAKGFVYESFLNDNRVCCVLGDPDVGKSLLFRELFNTVDDALLVAMVPNPPDDACALLREILTGYGFDDFEASFGEYLNILRAFLDHEQNQGRTPVIAIDAAETLSLETLEDFARLLTSGGRADDRLRVVLFASRQFEATLDATRLGRLAPRRFHLYGLGEDEVEDYVFHCLEAAGRPTHSLFSEAAMKTLIEHTAGLPGLINRVCESALKRTAEMEKARVIKATLQKTIKSMRLGVQHPHAEARYSIAPSCTPFGRESEDKIVITHSGKIMGTCALNQRRTMIGRHPTSDIHLDRSSVSLHHAQVLVDERGIHLFDMNSTNGVFVNFRRIQHSLLRNNDLIIVGDYRMKFVEGTERRHQPHFGGERKFAETVVIGDSDSDSKTPYLRRIK